MTPDQALQLCKPSVEFDLGQWKRKLKRDRDMPTHERIEALQRISELKRLLDYIDERRT